MNTQINNLQQLVASRQYRFSRRAIRAGIVFTLMVLTGCGGSNSSPAASVAQDASPPTTTTSGTVVSLPIGSSISPAVTMDAGPSPFISLVHVNYDPTVLTRVQYTIEPKPGSVSKPVHVEYSIQALAARGYLSSGSVTVPVFGLYAGYQNTVTMELTPRSGSPVVLALTIPTAAYTDPTDVYSAPDIVTRRAPGSALGFDFIYIKSALGSPIIIDTDGEIRWAAPGPPDSLSSALVGDTFVIGSGTQPTVSTLRLDGTAAEESLPQSDYTDFSHDIIRAKHGLLAEMDAESGGTANIDSNVIEMRGVAANAISIVSHWDMGAILSAYMTSQGDDAAAFVRPGTDWFHLNSAIYDPSDDSLIVSSRENFIIKIDYQTGAIKWIFGDPTKYWYTFPSLRAKALTLLPGGLYPIGQHGLSITPDGLLMLFNDGQGSLNQPPGEPAGYTRSFSAISAYSITPTTMTAREVWHYEADQAIFSPYCGSAYEADDNSLLVDFAMADGGTEALLVGLNPTHTPVFEFQYPTIGCNTSWIARPTSLDDLRIER